MENKLKKRVSRKRKASKIFFRNKWKGATIKNLTKCRNKEHQRILLTTKHISCHGAVLSETALRLPTVEKANEKENIMTDKNASEPPINDYFNKNNVVWKIPYSNGRGNPDSIVTIVPSEYKNKSQLCSALMDIVSSYILEYLPFHKDNDVSNEIMEKLKRARKNCVKEAMNKFNKQLNMNECILETSQVPCSFTSSSLNIFHAQSYKLRMLHENSFKEIQETNNIFHENEYIIRTPNCRFNSASDAPVDSTTSIMALSDEKQDYIKNLREKEKGPNKNESVLKILLQNMNGRPSSDPNRWKCFTQNRSASAQYSIIAESYETICKRGEKSGETLRLKTLFQSPYNTTSDSSSIPSQSSFLDRYCKSVQTPTSTSESSSTSDVSIPPSPSVSSSSEHDYIYYPLRLNK